MPEIDRERTRAALDEMVAQGPGAKRGRLFEDLIEQMLTSIDGVRVIDRDRLSSTGNEEIDFLVSNAQNDTGLPAFDNEFLVECKSQAEPVDAQAVNWLATKLRRRQLDWGIMVALAGVTGEREGWRAAVSEVHTSAVEGRRILVVVERELRLVRSAAHFAALLEAKRTRMIAARALYLPSADEINSLDPNPPREGIVFLHGADAIREAIRRLRRDALDELFDHAASADRLDVDEGVRLARNQLEHLEEDARTHSRDPGDDPLWLAIRSSAVEVGATLIRILDDHPHDDHGRKVVAFNVETVAPRQLRASSASELWRLLTDYFLRQVVEPTEQLRESSVYAILGLIVEELIAIDDIEPPDAYDNGAHSESVTYIAKGDPTGP